MQNKYEQFCVSLCYCFSLQEKEIYLFVIHNISWNIFWTWHDIVINRYLKEVVLVGFNIGIYHWILLVEILDGFGAWNINFSMFKIDILCSIEMHTPSILPIAVFYKDIVISLNSINTFGLFQSQRAISSFVRKLNVCECIFASPRFNF